MDDLSEYSSPVIEFLPTSIENKLKKLVDSSTETDPIPSTKDASIETNPKCHMGTQTSLLTAENAQVDEKKLAKWLQKVYPLVEEELLQGPTPIPENYNISGFLPQWNDTKIQTYQKISVGNEECSQALATWLSVHTNNASAFVVSPVAVHDNWCSHVNQSIKLFIPKRIHSGGNFVVYSESKSLQIKACLKSLCTNPFNKSIFAGSTMNGDLYIWYFEHTNKKGNNIEVKELYLGSAPHGFAVAMEWSSETYLLTCHSNGIVLQWAFGKDLILEREFVIRPIVAATSEITSICCLNSNDFVVGAKNGTVYHCWSSRFNSANKSLEIVPLKKHTFMVSSLLKTKMTDHTMVISCDLSGQVYYYNMRNTDDEAVNAIIQIPLPFKNSIACSIDGNVIYCPGADGSLECYRVYDGAYSIVKGALRGKGNLIKSSDNGHWILTGLYGNELQIFYVEE